MGKPRGHPRVGANAGLQTLTCGQDFLAAGSPARIPNAAGSTASGRLIHKPDNRRNAMRSVRAPPMRSVVAAKVTINTNVFIVSASLAWIFRPLLQPTNHQAWKGAARLSMMRFAPQHARTLDSSWSTILRRFGWA